jgi:antitoxin ParD1/3/4
MNVSLTRELQQFVARKLAKGSYHNASEVVQDGLRLLQETEKIRQKMVGSLRKEIRLGIEQADQGKTFPFTEEIIRRVKVRGRRRRKASRSASQ